MSARPDSDCVITGLGAMSCVGAGCDALWSAIDEGRDGIAAIDRFPTSDFPSSLGAQVPLTTPFEGTPSALARRFAIAAIREATAQARVGSEVLASPRTALVLGVSPTTDEPLVHEVAATIARELGLGGPTITVSTACTSSANAIAVGRELVLNGVADLVLAGGTDVLTREFFAGFCRLGVVCASPCAPFSEPVGTTLGEGAGIVILETQASARSRGADVLAALCGTGTSSDGFHETSPDPGGAGLARAIRAALGDAGLRPEDVGYFNAHGTGTEHNDAAEWEGIASAFGTHARALPVSSSKGMLGHAQAAAGALELIATVLAMQHQVLPQTLRFTTPRRRGPFDVVGEPRPRPARPAFAMSCNAAFGGSNTALVVGRDPTFRGKPRGRRAVALLGGATARSPVVDDLTRAVRNADPRDFDPAARCLTVAAARALVDAGVSVRGALRARSGLLVGSTRISASSAKAFQASIDESGVQDLSVRAFSRMVLNAPAGATSRALGLRGSHLTISTGTGSGLVAFVLAASALASRDDDDVIVSGAVDEIEAPAIECASCVVLAPRQAGAAVVRVLGAALASGDRLSLATADALAQSGITDRDVDAVFAAAAGDGPATGAVIAVNAAISSLRSGRIRTALVTTQAGDGVAAAVVLAFGGDE